MEPTVEHGVHAVVLAAGLSQRMGRPKPLLTSADRTLLSIAVDNLRSGGCPQVSIVVSRAAPDVLLEAARLGFVVEATGDPAAEPLDSIRLALAVLPDSVAGVLILPVDCPFVKPETVATILRRHATHADAAVVPMHQGRPGHPVLVGRPLLGELRDGSLPEGLRTLLARNAGLVAAIEVDDDAVLVDLDTPADARARHVRA